MRIPGCPDVGPVFEDAVYPGLKSTPRERPVATNRSFRSCLLAQPVDATPSDINLFSIGGDCVARETSEAFRFILRFGNIGESSTSIRVE